MPISPSSTAHRLGTDGEMARRTNSFDWSKHPLGSMSTWQRSLKTIVHTMLNCRIAMWLGWGPELYFFCNDACLATIGNKESWALGSSAKNVWAEIGPDIGPRAESVLQSGQATCDESLLLFLQRGRNAEETHHTFSYSPVLDDTGAIGGVLCVVTEDDQRIGGERLQAGKETSERSNLEAARRESEQRYRALVDGLPAAVYSTDAQGRITLYNQAAAALWGREPKIGVDKWCASDRIFRPDGALLPLDQCPMAVALKEGRPIYGEEIVIERPDGTRRHVLANPQPVFNSSGAIVGAVNMLIDITETQKAQRALHQSEERFVRFMHHLPGAAWIKDLEGHYAFANETTLKTFGTTRENLYAKTDKDFLPPSTVALFRENDRLALLNEAGVQRMVQVERDGATHHLVVHKFPIPGSADEQTLVGGIAIDITEHKRAEDALRQSEERFRLATQTGKVGVWDWDIARDRVAWTDSLYPIHGLKPGDFAGTVEAFAALVHPQDRERVSLAINRALQENMPYDLEFRLIRPDGEVIWIYTCATVLREQDRPVRMIGATVDITDRKRVEAALQRRSERIQLLSETLAQLLGASDLDRIAPDLFGKVAAHVGADTYFNFLVDEPGDMLQLHSYAGISEVDVKSVERLKFGDAICGTVAKTHQAITANDIQSSDDEKTALVRRLGIQTYVCNPLMVGDKLFGTLCFASHTRKFFADDELELLRIISQYTAIEMERLRTAKSLRASEERLQQEATELEEQLIASGRLVSLGEVTASMAHEFNNPLGIILGFAQDILSVVDSNDPNYRALQIIDEEARRCQRIVQGLMDLARPQTTELNPTRINEIITRTVSLVESRLYKQKIELQTAVMPDLPRILADHQQLEQVLVNLLLNAIDAMPEGGKLSIAATTERKDGKLSMVISISDTGVGIDKDMVSKIFLPFYTAGKKRGLGLGLSVCKRIVKNHGGTIELESELGKGTTFKLYLPLRLESAPSPESSVSA